MTWKSHIEMFESEKNEDFFHGIVCFMGIYNNNTFSQCRTVAKARRHRKEQKQTGCGDAVPGLTAVQEKV